MCVVNVCHYSSVVEHVIGNDGVVSPILISGTINKKLTLEVGFLLMRIGGKKRTYVGVSPTKRFGYFQTAEDEARIVRGLEHKREMRCVKRAHLRNQRHHFLFLLLSGAFFVCRVISHKVRLFGSLKYHFYKDYRTFYSFPKN